MGIPTYFRYLFENYGEKIVKLQPPSCDYLYFDFNSILYKVYYDDIDNNQNETILIQNIFKALQSICKYMNPKKGISIFFDGPVPRAKMVQQRSRRYKSIQLETELRKNKLFSPSNNICPGTEFMTKLALFLEKNLYKIERELSSHPSIFMSSSNTFGEGEHKMMPCIRNMVTQQPNATIIVMSPDNDLLSLLILTEKKSIYLMRFLDSYLQRQLQLEESDSDRLVFITIDFIAEQFKKHHCQNFSSIFSSKAKDAKDAKDAKQVDELSFLIDYNFLLSIAGNDFVVTLPYMRIKKGGMSKLLDIYTTILKQEKTFLINRHEDYKINISFFRKILIELSKKERSEWKQLAVFIDKEKSYRDLRFDDENIPLIKQLENKINHMYMCNQNHPWFETYQTEFSKIDFHCSSNDMRVLKREYYSYFLQETNPQKLYVQRKEMVTNYLESLVFTLLYYNKGCPSNDWHYKFRSAPFFSDILYFIDHGVDMNHFQFEPGKIYTPFHQLMLILPPQSKTILPTVFHSLFSKYKFNYPTTFQVDAVVGLKYIYSDAILPEFQDEEQFYHDIKKIEESLSDKEAMRNSIEKLI